MGITLSKYYLIITMVTATPEFGTDLFIFHQESETQQECLDRLSANPDKQQPRQRRSEEVRHARTVR